jgi:hypothetical protein
MTENNIKERINDEIQELRPPSEYTHGYTCGYMSGKYDALEVFNKHSFNGVNESAKTGCKLVPLDNPVTSEMKAACIAEFSYASEEPEFDEDGEFTGEHYTRINVVPWDTCKQIYKGMLKAAPTVSSDSYDAKDMIEALSEAVTMLIQARDMQQYAMSTRQFKEGESEVSALIRIDTYKNYIDRWTSILEKHRKNQS